MYKRRYVDVHSMSVSQSCLCSFYAIPMYVTLQIFIYCLVYIAFIVYPTTSVVCLQNLKRDSLLIKGYWNSLKANPYTFLNEQWVAEQGSC